MNKFRFWLKTFGVTNLVALLAQLNEAFPSNKYIMMLNALAVGITPMLVPDRLSHYMAPNKSVDTNGKQ